MAYYKIHKFKEGGTLLYREDKSVEAVDVSIYITTGAAADGEKPGLSHFLEHMLFCETINHKESEIDSKSKELHNNQNAFTSSNAVCLVFTSPVRNLEASMKHNGDLLCNSTFPEDKIEREKEVVISEKLMYESYPYDLRDRLYDNLIYNCYGDSLFTSLIGTEESIRSITRQDLIEYREKYFNRNNIVISMVGNVSYQEAKALCKKYIISKVAPVGPMFIPEVQNVYLNRNINLIRQEVNSNLSVIQFAFPFVGKQNYKNALLSSFLAEYLRKKIHNVLRQKEGLLYSPYVYDIQYSNDGLFIIEIETANHKTNAVIREIAKLIGDIILEGITEEEFLTIKQDYIDAGAYGHSNYVVGKSRALYNSYINNNRVYTDKERKDTFSFLNYKDLDDYMLKTLNANVIVNYIGNRKAYQMYNAEQIQALFLLNKFTEEELEELYGYKAPDMGCPGEYQDYKEVAKNFFMHLSSQKLIAHYQEKKKQKQAKKAQQEVKPKTFEELPLEKRNRIKEILKEDLNIDLDTLNDQIESAIESAEEELEK